MRSFIALTLVTATLVWVTPLVAADAAAGKTLYGTKCASCHGATGEAKESIAKMFGVEMKPLASKEVQAKSDADLKKMMLEGGGKMKPVKDLTEKNAEDIAAYLRTMAKK
jgi:mono/diheme cytochrome c family protein